VTAFLTALPAIIKLLTELFAWVKEASKEDPAKGILEITAAIKQVRGAANVEERRAAVRALSRIINRM
jgi:hypothetical protein